jgi:hypothetical protein
MVTADEGSVVYLDGLRPTQTDCQVPAFFRGRFQMNAFFCVTVADALPFCLTHGL